MSFAAIDDQLGSIIESWTTRDTGEGCRFCGEPVGDVDPAEKFCDEKCSDRFDTVVEARIALGKRDVEQRGFD